MMKNDEKIVSDEKRILRHSIYVAVIFALLGIVWGLAINSSVIIFDGIYSSFSVLLSLLSLLAAKALTKPEDETFQYGRAALEPVVVAFKAVSIVLMCGYALFTAVGDIVAGGTEVPAGWGILYAAISASGSFLFWRYISGKQRNSRSDLMRAEAEQWLMDAMLSLGVMLGFLLSFGLSFTQLNSWTPYIDPGMVVIVSLYFGRVPIKTLIQAMREILWIAPDKALQREVIQRVEQVITLEGAREIVIRQAKIGRELELEVGILTDPDCRPGSVRELDELRQAVEENLESLGLKLWLTVNISADRKWL